MKYTLLIALTFIMISCGIEGEEPGLESINKVQSIKANDSYKENEVKIAESICALMTQKEYYLDRQVIMLNKKLSYDYSEISCGSDKPASEVFSAAIISSNSLYRLDTTSSKYFSTIQSKSSKLLSEFCAGITTETKRHSEEGSIVSWSYLLDSTNPNCTGSGNYCLIIETGYKENANQYRIKDLEAYMFSGSTSLIPGLVIEQSFVTTQRCSKDGEYHTKAQSFKSIAN